ncbi:MAG: DNA alkylation repair protein [Pirellulaceae bacterium]
MVSKSRNMPGNLQEEVASVIASLKRISSKKVRDGMARFAIPSDKAFGVPVGMMRQMAKRLGGSHELAAGLWETGWYEGRMMAAFVDEPAEVTSEQMDRWCGLFDNWAICDTVCFHLFDRTPLAWKRLAPWSKLQEEFPRRGAFALLWGLTVHDKKTQDEPFLKGLKLIERAATDERNFVKKAVNMALRATGKRNPSLHAAAVETAQRLKASKDRTARWVGSDALRELASSSVMSRLAKKHGTASM